MHRTVEVTLPKQYLGTLYYYLSELETGLGRVTYEDLKFIQDKFDKSELAIDQPISTISITETSKDIIVTVTPKEVNNGTQN